MASCKKAFLIVVITVCLMLDVANAQFRPPCWRGLEIINC